MLGGNGCSRGTIGGCIRNNRASDIGFLSSRTAASHANSLQDLSAREDSMSSAWRDVDCGNVDAGSVHGGPGAGRARDQLGMRLVRTESWTEALGLAEKSGYKGEGRGEGAYAGIVTRLSRSNVSLSTG